jgi:hypothetical protein
MLLQTNSYIVPKEKRVEHARLLRRFRQALARVGCDHFEVYEQVGSNWTGETTGRFVQIMRFRDRQHQLAVQAAEREDQGAQDLIREFCELINFPYQQQQGFFAVGFYTSVMPVAPQSRPGSPEVSSDSGAAVAAAAAVGVGAVAETAAEQTWSPVGDGGDAGGAAAAPAGEAEAAVAVDEEQVGSSSEPSEEAAQVEGGGEHSMPEIDAEVISAADSLRRYEAAVEGAPEEESSEATREAADDAATLSEETASEPAEGVDLRDGSAEEQEEAAEAFDEATAGNASEPVEAPTFDQEPLAVTDEDEEDAEDELNDDVAFDLLNNERDAGEHTPEELVGEDENADPTDKGRGGRAWR